MKKLLTFAVALLAFLTFTVSAGAQDWYDEAWQYRVSVSVENPCGETLTDYQVQILLDSSFDFDNALVDGSDLRVTDSDGLTLIPFWIEDWDYLSSASIWVKVPEISALGTTTIYLYYGNLDPPGPELVEVPPIGPWDKALGNPIVPKDDPQGGSGLLAENMVYDNITGHYWLVFAVYRGGSRVGLAWSDDPGDPTAWNWHGIVVQSANAPHLIEHEGTWYIFYADKSRTASAVTGYTGLYPNSYPISVATSPTVNGIYTYADTVLTSEEPWEATRVDEPYVFQRSDGKWILVYMGDAGSTTEVIGYAEADDILGPYTKFSGNPCIDFGPPGSIDAGTVADPWVVEFQGTYYIGYTVSSSKSSPWRTAYATTTDWETFTKHGITLDWGSAGEWDQCNAFRGAVSRFGDTYYFPYTGRYCSGSPIGGYIMGIATQPAYMFEEINTCEGVFEFCDTFDVDGDISKWTVQEYNGPHNVTVSGGQLNMTANYHSGPYGYAQMRGNVAIGAGTLLEAFASHSTAGEQCDADTDTDNAAEVGYKASDMGWSNVIRVMDYTDPIYYTIQASSGGANSGYVPTDLQLDTNWQEYRIYRDEAGNAYCWINGSLSSFDLGSPYVPTIALYPWLMSYAEPCADSSTFEVDWIRVRNWCGQDALAALGAEEQYTIDVAIDVKPGSDTNSINLGSNGVIPVAIFSTNAFDATQIDPDTVELGGSEVAVRGKGNKSMAHEEDVNGDGLIDLVVQVETENFDESSFQDGSVVLQGETYEGKSIRGSDEITIVPESS